LCTTILSKLYGEPMVKNPINLENEPKWTISSNS
jgi:hypothetical protein